MGKERDVDWCVSDGLDPAACASRCQVPNPGQRLWMGTDNGVYQCASDGLRAHRSRFEVPSIESSPRRVEEQRAHRLRCQVPSTETSVRAMGEEPIARLQAGIQSWANCIDHHHQLHRSGASSFGNELVQSARLDESLTVGRPVLSADKRLASLKPLHLKATEADSVERGGGISEASRLSALWLLGAN